MAVSADLSVLLQERARTRCLACGDLIDEQNKSPVVSCCFDCWEKQEAAEEVISSSPPPVLASSPAGPVASPDSATASPETPPSAKVSKCTMYQRKMKEVGVSKTTALEQWKAMSSAERDAWAASVPELCAKQKHCPQSSEKEQQAKKKLKVSQNAAESLQSFRTKWAPVSEAMSQLEDPAKWHICNADLSFQIYADVARLLHKDTWQSAVAAAKDLPELHLNRKKISKVSSMLSADASSLDTTPMQFLPGRQGKGYLTDAQKRDLLRHVEFMQRSNFRFSAADCMKAMYRYWLLNTGRVKTKDEPTNWDLYTEHMQEMKHAFRNWKQWVKDTQPKSSHIQTRKLQGVKSETAASCTPAAVRAHFQALQALLEETGIMKDGKVVDAHRLWAADEKGQVDLDGKIKMATGLSLRGLGPPTCAAGGSSYKHLTVSWLVSLQFSRCM